MLFQIKTTALVTSLLMIVAPGIATTALADPAVKISVRVSGADMTQPEAGAMLLERIRASARRACIAPGHATRQSTAGCVRDATASAVRELNIATLTAALNDPRPVIQTASR